MKFGRTLELAVYAPWRKNYLDYAKLKKLLREDEPAESDQKWTDEDESAFVDELVNVQLEKVHAFHQSTHEKLRERTAKCESRLDSIAAAESDEAQETDGKGNGKKAVPSEAERKKILKETLEELDQITKETNELEKYSRINYTGFLKAAKKHDRKRGHSYRVRPLLQVRLANMPFNKEDYSPLLYRLSAMYNFVRQHLDESDGSKRLSTLTETHEGKEDYSSYKFWVHPDNLLEVKTMILRRLPVLVYNPQTSKVAEGTQRDPSITSIYFDNPSFNLYTHKVDNGEASSLRLRWYGQLNARPDIWVEKKTVSDENSSHESRFTTKEKYVQGFIKGEYRMDKQIKKIENRTGVDSLEARHLRESVSEIQEFIQENDLQPVLRANYTRTAFQIPGDDKIRISLDTNVAFIREDAIDGDRPCRDPETWHRSDIDSAELEFPFSTVRKGEIVRFPFALLEIKMRNSDRKNEWISDLMHSHLVKEAPRFSKFVHGVAQLFEDYVNTFPFWLSEMETDIRRDPQKAFEEEQAKRQKELDDDFAVGSLIKQSKVSSSPASKSQPSSILSPQAGPAGMRASSNPATGSLQNRPSGLSKSPVAASNQPDEIAEEADEDETGVQAPLLGSNGHYAAQDGTRAPTDFLTSLFPSFSTSKYAQSRRSAHQGPLPDGVNKPTHWLKDAGPVKVEAKVWLANQRTFVKWQHVSILLATLSLGLYNAAGENNRVAQTLAVVYTAIAVFTGIWGYGVFLWRTRLIERRSGKDFDALTGPIVVCVALTFALILNFWFKYRAAREHQTHHNHGHRHSHDHAASESLAGPGEDAELPQLLATAVKSLASVATEAFAGGSPLGHGHGQGQDVIAS